MAEIKIILSAKNFATATIKKVRAAMLLLRGAIKRTEDSFRTLRGRVALFGGAFTAFQLSDSFLDANIQMEKMKLQLQALTGSSKKAMEAVKFIFDFASKIPARSIKSLQKAFVQLKASGIDPTNGSLKALVESSIAFGATEDEFQGIVKAIVQMKTKGVVAMEELRGQLAEKLPGAIEELAKQMNLTSQELIKLVGTGTLEADLALNALFQGLTRKFGGTAKKLKGTWDDVINSFRLEWHKFLVDFGDAGAFNKVKGFITRLTESLKKNRSELLATASAVTELISGALKDIFGVTDSSNIVSIFKSMVSLAAKFYAWLSEGMSVLKNGLQLGIKLINDMAAGLSKVNLGFGLRDIKPFESLKGLSIPGGIDQKEFKRRVAEQQKQSIALINKVTAALNKNHKKAILDTSGDIKNFNENLAIGSLSNAERFRAGWDKSLRSVANEYKAKFGDMQKLGETFAKETTSALSGAFENFFFDVIEGRIKKLKDIFTDFAKSVARSIARITSERLAIQLIAGISGTSVSLDTTPKAGIHPSSSLQKSATSVSPVRKKTNAVGVKVEIVNQSNQPVQASDASVRDDGSGLVVSIVLDALSRNKGGLRDAVRAV